MCKEHSGVSTKEMKKSDMLANMDLNNAQFIFYFFHSFLDIMFCPVFTFIPSTHEIVVIFFI